MHLLNLINPWLNLNYQITTKCATVPKHKLFHQLNTPSYLEAPDKRRRTKGEPERTVYARLPAPGVRPTRPTDSWNLISSLVSFGKAHSTQKKMDKFPPHRREPSKKKPHRHLSIWQTQSWYFWYQHWHLSKTKRIALTFEYLTNTKLIPSFLEHDPVIDSK